MEEHQAKCWGTWKLGWTHGTCVTPNDSETINPQRRALYTIVLPYFFGSDASLDISGVVSPTFVALSWWMAMANIVQQSWTKSEIFFEAAFLISCPICRVGEARTLTMPLQNGMELVDCWERDTKIIKNPGKGVVAVLSYSVGTRVLARKLTAERS
jgi:hypothetical protein